jgi:hypothetical protein
MTRLGLKRAQVATTALTILALFILYAISVAARG